MTPPTSEDVSLEDFEYVRAALLEATAIELSDDKAYLVNTRLSVIAREFEMSGPREVVARLRNSPTREFRQAVINSLTTNETFFFRENQSFRALRLDVLPALLKSRPNNRHLRIWCAGCSTGQEPYSLAMLLAEELRPAARWTYEIWATDIDSSALTRAQKGHYHLHEVNRGLPALYLTRYFERQGGHWQIDPRLGTHIAFEQVNLAGRWPQQAPFDLIFMRNILIYFGRETKQDVLRRAASQLSDDGHLILGASESAFGLSTGLERLNTGHGVLYRRKRTDEAVA